MSALLLTICVPTYNRHKSLEECLVRLEPQIRGRNDVELVISDNASDDATPAVVARYASLPNVRAFRNETNLEMDGNTVVLMERAAGRYVAFMSDDDLPTPGYIEAIVGGISKYHPSIIYLNYYGFEKDPAKPLSFYFPVADVRFQSLGEAVLYCGLSHFSALTVERAPALEALRDFPAYESRKASRGYVFAAFGCGAFAYGGKGGLFVGARVVAARVPEKIDYDSITNTSIDFVRHLDYWRVKGAISEKYFRAKVRQIASSLPRAILNYRIRSGGAVSSAMRRDLAKIFGRLAKFWLVCLPLLLLPKWLLKVPYLLLRKGVRFARHVSIAHKH